MGQRIRGFMERPSRDAFAARFDAYVSELRVVFAGRGLRFGRPKDVTAIAQALHAPGGAQEDVTAVVRSILYREHEGLSRAELASVVVVAAGGTDLYASAQEGDAVQQLDAFINSVRLAVRAKALVESEQVETGMDEVVATPEEARPAVGSAVEVPLRREEVYAEEDVNEVLQPATPRAERASVLAGIYSQAQRMSEIERGGGGGGKDTYFLKAKAEPENDGDLVEGDGETLEERAAGSYWGWVVGLCVIAAALAAGLVWRHRTAARVEEVSREGSPVGSAAGDATSKVGGAVQRDVAQGGVPLGRRDVLGVAAEQHGDGKPVVGIPSGSASGSRGAYMARAVPVPDDHVAAPASVAAATPPASATSAASSPPLSEKASEPAVTPTPPAPKPKHEVFPPAGAVSPAVAGKYVVSSGVMSGNLIAAPEPAYPKMAKMWGIEGQVILQAVISSKGKVVAAHVLDGHKMLRGSAMNAVRKWRYKPYVVEGRPTDVATVVIVEYKLKP